MDQALPVPAPKQLSVKKNPYAMGFLASQRGKTPSGFLHKRSLLKLMLDVELRPVDLPTHIADAIRKVAPGWLDNIDRKFTMYQVMELVQLQLLFSESDYVRQQAIDAIKDRVEGKPVQKLQLAPLEEPDPAELILPGGRRIVI